MRVRGELGFDSEDIKTTAVEVVLVSLLLTLGVFRTLYWCLCCLVLIRLMPAGLVLYLEIIVFMYNYLMKNRKNKNEKNKQKRFLLKTLNYLFSDYLVYKKLT